MRTKTGQMLAGLVLAAVALGARQAPPAAPAPEFGAAIDVRAVNVEAVVTDRHGNRVQGLKAGDFRLLVDGREVPVDYFTEIVNGEAAGPAAEPAAPAPGAPASPVPPGRVGTSYLVFIDESFTIAAQRDLLLKSLENDLRIGSEDRMAVVAFDGRKLDLLSDWTGDREALRRTLQAARLRPVEGVKRLVKRRQAVEDIAGPGGEQEDLFSEAQSAADAAAAAMRGVSQPSGRKVLLLLSSGWAPLATPPWGETPFDGLPSAADLARFSDLFEPVTGTANLLGYTIYPVSAPGPVAESSWADASDARPVPFRERGFISSYWDLGVGETTAYLARETGGVPIYSSWRLSAFARAEQDTRSYYWLGFTPEWHADGRNHQIRVEVRRAGLSVRSRSGFADLTQSEQAALRTDGLLLFGTTPDGQRIQVETGTPERAGWRSIELPVTLVVPADLLTPSPVAGGYELRAKLAMTSVDRWGGNTSLLDLALRLKLAAAPRPGDFARFQTRLKLRKLDQRLVFALQDEAGDGQGRGELDFKP